MKDIDITTLIIGGVLLYCFVGAVIATGDWFWIAILAAPVVAYIHERMNNGE